MSMLQFSHVAYFRGSKRMRNLDADVDDIDCRCLVLEIVIYDN